MERAVETRWNCEDTSPVKKIKLCILLAREEESSRLEDGNLVCNQNTNSIFRESFNWGLVLEETKKCLPLELN